MFRDQLGSVRGVVEGTDWVERSVYRPFGESARWVDPAEDPESHNDFGERRDETGLMYLNARYYDPALGHFLSPDWFPVSEPGVGVHRYGYAGFDPVNRLDPSGNWYEGKYETYPTYAYNTDPNLNNFERALANTGIFALNTLPSLGNLVADGIYGTGEALAPYAGPVENAAITTPTAADDALAAVFRGWTRISVAAGESRTLQTAYMQTDYREQFSAVGREVLSEIAGVPIRTIDDLSGAITSGQVRAADIPVNFVVRDGVRVITDTRTSVALRRADVSPQDWNWVDRTGDAVTEARVDEALSRNRLQVPITTLND